MFKIVLVCPGSTDFDEQGRIKGTLDVPMNAAGNAQVAQTISETNGLKIRAIYCSPCQCSLQTAEAIAAPRELKPKILPELTNLDHGLWHGKLIAEVKQRQPKVYRQWQEHPESVCPPGGETIASMQRRFETALAKLRKKHKDETIVLVTPEPLASIVRSSLKETKLGDIWKVECNSGGWEILNATPQ